MSRQYEKKSLNVDQVARVAQLYEANPSYVRVSKIFSEEEGSVFGPAVIGRTIREFAPHLIFKGTGLKHSAEQQEEIRNLYRSGTSVNAIAGKFDAAFDTIKSIIGEEFVPDQGSGSAQRILCCPDVERLAILAAAPDYGLQEIAEEFDVSTPIISRWLKENDITNFRKRPPTKLDQDVHEKLSDEAWISENYTKYGIKVLGDRLGIADGTVSRYMDKLGLARDATFSCSSSKPEQELAEILSQYVEIETNKRTILDNRFELDIFIPEKNIAIEFNGLYWHREDAKGRSYHFDKWRACQEKGIQLFQIWEDDWQFRKEIALSSLLTKIGISDGRKVGARKCDVIELDHNTSSSFMDKFHIQGGGATGSVKLGLSFQGELVACMIFGKTNKTYTLHRYATSINVQGGFTKLLRYFERNFHPEKLVTFADLCISDGGLYESTGFKAEKIIPPDYRYYVGNRRVHKFNYRKSRFESDSNLEFQDGLTERELADLNKIYRIYDAGKIRYVKTYDVI